MTLRESLESPNLLYIRARMLGGKIWGYAIIHIDPTSPSGKLCVHGGPKEEVEPLVQELRKESHYVSPTEML